VAHPQIAAFARLAEGGTPPNRKIEGQSTLLGRTMHAIAYDEIHDEVVVPQQFAQAVLTFRGGASGEEPPVRVIQGSLTQLEQLDQLAIDPVHNEIFVPERDHVLVFSRLANGNVAPIRVLKGPDAFRSAATVAVDPVHNLLLVTGTPPGAGEQPRGAGAGIMIFDRTAQGNVKPKAVISGPNVSLSGGNARIYAYPPRELFLVVATQPGGSGGGSTGPTAGVPVDGSGQMASNRGFVGVWSIHDKGDVPPRWKIGGPNGMLLAIRGVALDPKHKTVIISDKRLNALLTYSFPEIF